MRGKDCFLTTYFLCCCAAVLLVSTIRSGPVYGKLDFLLLESRPWWPRWQPMIEEVLRQGQKPILSDPITSMVFRGIFNQDTLYYRDSRGITPLRIEEMDKQSKEERFSFPRAAVCLLLTQRQSERSAPGPTRQKMQNHTMSLPPEGMRPTPDPNQYRYRCVVNLQGFPSSWVPRETLHWWPDFAKTAGFYSFHSISGRRRLMEEELRRFPPTHCQVYYRLSRPAAR